MTAQVRYIHDADLTWQRVKHGTGFRYLDKNNEPLPEKSAERIGKLVIPPAWTDVRIAPHPQAHIQAVGIDAKGRKQYIYHPDWVAQNQQHKFDALRGFGEVLPPLRETIRGHMRQHSLTQDRVLATIVWLLENTFIRVGNKNYAQENQSYGLTTLREKHAQIEGNTLTLSFKGKSHVYHELSVHEKRIIQTVQQCIELPGYELFQYLDENEQRHSVDSSLVNDYLRSITGQDLTAKDFRTWGGTTLAGQELFQRGQETDAKAQEKVVVETVRSVAEHLGNTVAVCRQYYIHPKIITTYQEGKLVPHFEKVMQKHQATPFGLSAEEYAVWQLI